MEDTSITKWFPALIYELPKREENIILKLFGKVFALNVFLSIIAALVLGKGEEAAFFKESEFGGSAAFLNLIIFLSIVILYTLLIYLFIKMKKFNILEILGITLLAFLSGSIASIIIPIWLYIIAFIIANGFNAYFILNVIEFLFGYIIIIIFVFFFIMQILVLVSTKFVRYRNIMLLTTVSWSGVLLGLYTGFLTPIIVMFGFAIYDIYAVFKGPLKKITHELEGMIKPTVNHEKRSIFILGLGDIFFYSMAIAYSLVYFGLITFVFVVIALGIGVIITLKILLKAVLKHRGRELPALPLPIFLALAVICVSYLLL